MEKNGIWRILPSAAFALVLGSAMSAKAEEPVSSCGYTVETGFYSTWLGGYEAWVQLNNVAGAAATDFHLLVDIGDTEIVDGWQAEYSLADGGYFIDAPSWLQYQTIPEGQSYTFAFNAAGEPPEVSAYVININGDSCDEQPPVIGLSVNQGLFTSGGTLTLTAQAEDNVAVRKVIFEQDGQAIGEDWDAPYTLELPVDEALNGRHVYTARAIDPSDNETSDSERIYVAINNRYLGSAAGSSADYEDFLTYFDQITPENAGKWGSVEAVRDQMVWDDLDTAYDFARLNGLPFRLHTLVWGAQQPAWLDELTPAEQLAEIQEWMSALGERYPDADFVDVVNEPLHSVPSYVEALGGEGESGIDWVLNAFSLARSYFPNSELHLNDYAVVIWPDFTSQYLAIVEQLQALDLIDGIGIQGHFLERAELAVVEANLAALSDTGLPIFVTEFDVNLANDAHQANVYADLFSIFWENPSVLGLTNWGYRQGGTWQDYSYLLDSDGTPRPALDWVLCTIADQGECPLPEYIPEPRVGDEYGITLEAELYDEAHGVLAAGNVVGYSDPGDSIGFDAVILGGGWDTLWVTYSRDYYIPASISIFIDDNVDPSLTVELPDTGGWGNLQTVEVPWPAVAGEHAISIVWNDVANLDKIRIGRPAPEGEELVANGDFETDASGWSTWNDATISISSDRAYTGSHSLLVTGPGTGPAAIDLTAAATPGTDYTVSLWTSVGGVASAQVNLTLALNCGDGTSYSWVANNNNVPSDDWAQLGGTVSIPEVCDLQQFVLYAEGGGANVDLYIDTVSVLAPPSASTLEFVDNGDFEEDASGWYTWNGSVAVTTARAHSGSQSLLASGGSATGPAATELSGAILPGLTYDISMWVSVGGVESAPVNATVALNCGEGTSYNWINAVTADADWTEITGSISVPEGCDLQQFQLYAEGTEAADLYLDDVSVSAPAPSEVVNVLPNGDFETDASGWYTWNGAEIGVTDTRAYTGQQSLLVTGSGTGPAATSIASLVQDGTSYDVSFWVSVGGVDTAQVNVTLAMDCGDGTSYSWIGNNNEVPSDDWVEIAGVLDIPTGCLLDQVQLYAEGGGAAVDLYVDNVVIAERL